MNLQILGSGTCAVTEKRSCACYAVTFDEITLLLDIGFGALRRITEAGIDYREIDAVMCTHHHLDHIGDLSPLLMALRWTPNWQRTKPLTLIGPSGFREFMQSSRDLFGEWILDGETYDIQVVELNNDSYNFKGCKITAVPMNHTRAANGYRLEQDGSSLAYSGDTGPCAALVELCRDVDMAIVESSFPDDQPFDHHLTPIQAAQYARRSGCSTLVLSHFYPMMEKLDLKEIVRPYFHGDIIIAQDFSQFTIDNGKFSEAKLM